MNDEKTLRDEFAMAAMNGLLSSPGEIERDTFDDVVQSIADMAYEYADAMLERREQ